MAIMSLTPQKVFNKKQKTRASPKWHESLLKHLPLPYVAPIHMLMKAREHRPLPRPLRARDRGNTYVNTFKKEKKHKHDVRARVRRSSATLNT